MLVRRPVLRGSLRREQDPSRGEPQDAEQHPYRHTGKVRVVRPPRQPLAHPRCGVRGGGRRGLREYGWGAHGSFPLRVVVCRMSEEEGVNREDRALFNPKNRRVSIIHARRPATLRQAQGPSSPPLSSLSLSKRTPRSPQPSPPPLRPFDKLRVLPPTPKFVEPVETNPEITVAFAPAPTTLRQAQGPSSPPRRPFDRLRVLPPGGPGVALLRLHFLSLRRRERGGGANHAEGPVRRRTLVLEY